jgi:hypothetical protein
MKGECGEIGEEEGEGSDGKGGEEKNDKIKITLLFTLCPFSYSSEHDLEGS